jgi:hypothetical protein
MSKWYRRMQLISTAVMLFPSAVLLMFGYLSATRPRHSAAEAVVLFVLAVALPPLVYGGWALVIWLKRGQQPGADPSSLAARLGKKPYLGFIPVGLMLALLALLSRVNPGSSSTEAKEDVFVNMRTSCVSGAVSAAKRGGLDPGKPAAKARIDSYCSCFVLEMQTQYTSAELAKFAEGGGAGMAKDKKFLALIDKCQEQAIGR